MEVGEGVGDDALHGLEEFGGELGEAFGVLEELAEGFDLGRVGFEDGVELIEGEALGGGLVGVRGAG